MSIQAKPANTASKEWERLVANSHQTSLFVTPSWLEADRPVVVGAWEGGSLTTALIVRDLNEFPTAAPYQGLILSAASRPSSVDALIDWVEGIGGQPTAWNAPSMIDVRPFQYRLTRGRRWSEHIRYTFFVTSPPELGYPSDVEKTGARMELLKPATQTRRCLEADCVKFYEDDGGLVAWGVDPQGRGYIVDFTGDFVPLAKRLISTVKDADVGGCWGWAKSMKPKLRTSYGLTLVE